MNDNYYDDFCKDRFDKHEAKIDKLMIVVQNGLTHRTARIERTLWFICTIVIGKIALDFFL